MTSVTPSRSRPDGVTLAAIWFILGAILPFLGALAIMIFAYPAVLTDTTSGIDRYLAVAGVSFGLLVVLAILAANIAAAVGLLRLRPWGRMLAIVLAALGLIWFPIGTIVGALIIWYLLSEEAQQAFGAAPPAAPAPTIERKAA